jgi:uncharacterized protein (TIGR02145 family)
MLIFDVSQDYKKRTKIMTIMRKMIFLLAIFAITACKKDETEINSLTDIDGNSYKTITIGNQIWMAENLRVTRYPDGTKIPNIVECTDWQSLGTNSEGFCFYEDSTKGQYGAYYTYAAAKKACPTGWHLPTKNEWEELKIYLYNNGYNGVEGGTLKSKTGWNNNGNGKDNYEFNALPSGRRYRGVISNECIGKFYSIGESANWWSSTEFETNFGYYIWLSNSSDNFNVGNDVKKSGFSVRCIKDKK